MRIRDAFEVRFLRFLVVGVMNTAFSYAVYACFLWLGLNYALANLGALLLGIAFSFKTQGALVFRNPDNRLLVRFTLFWAVIYALNIAFIKAMLLLGLNAYVAGLLALPVVTLLSYLGQRSVVFGTRRAAPNPKPGASTVPGMLPRRKS